MRPQEILYTEVPKLAGGPFKVLIVKLKQVKPSNHGVHGRSSDFA